MRISKWVDMGADVDVEIGVDDIRASLAEAFQNITEDRLGEPGPNRAEIMKVFNDIAQFLKAVTDAQISLLNFGQIMLIEKFLSEQAARYKLVEDPATGGMIFAAK